MFDSYSCVDIVFAQCFCWRRWRCSENKGIVFLLCISLQKMLFLHPSFLWCIPKYMYFVIVNIRFIGKELSKIINHKTPEVRDLFLLLFFCNPHHSITGTVQKGDPWRHCEIRGGLRNLSWRFELSVSFSFTLQSRFLLRVHLSMVRHYLSFFVTLLTYRFRRFDKHPSSPTCRTKVGAQDVFEEPSGNTNIHLQENGIGLSISFEDL